MTWGARTILTGALVVSLLGGVGLDAAVAQTIPPPIPQVQAGRRACDANGNVIVDVTISNPYAAPLTITRFDYVLPIPLPFPGGAGGSAIAPNPIPALGSAAGVDVVIPTGEIFVIAMEYTYDVGSGAQPIEFAVGSCPSGSTSVAPPPTSTAPPVVRPAFTG